MLYSWTQKGSFWYFEKAWDIDSRFLFCWIPEFPKNEIEHQLGEGSCCSTLKIGEDCWRLKVYEKEFSQRPEHHMACHSGDAGNSHGLPRIDRDLATPRLNTRLPTARYPTVYLRLWSHIIWIIFKIGSQIFFAIFWDRTSRCTLLVQWSYLFPTVFEIRRLLDPRSDFISVSLTHIPCLFACFIVWSQIEETSDRKTGGKKDKRSRWKQKRWIKRKQRSR